MPWGRVLMIDEDAVFRRFVSEYLAREGIELISTSRADAFALKEAARAHIVILSTGIAEEDGTDLIRKLRAERNVPLILISSAGDRCDEELSELVTAEMTKPLDITILYEHLLTLLPTAGSIELADRAQYRGLIVDLAEGTVEADGVRLRLSVKEAELLHLLVSYPGRMFSREELASHVWGRILTDDSTVSVHINHIRKKIGRYADNIAAVRGVGYTFRA